MWLNDGHFAKGAMEPYVPYMQKLLPDSRLYFFVTDMVVEHEKNRREGTMVIVIYRWRGFVTNTNTDFIGIANVLNIQMQRMKNSEISKRNDLREEGKLDQLVK
jgi:hypothetical protein